MKMLYDIIAGIISMIAKSLGVSYATANVAWSLYLQGLVCILSCLLLLIPMRKRGSPVKVCGLGIDLH